MSEFENHKSQVAMIAKEVEWRLGLIGIDWHNDSDLRSIARDALAFKGNKDFAQFDSGDSNQRLRAEIFGFIGLLLTSLEEAAQEGEKIEAGEFWNKLSQALWIEKGLVG